MARIISHLFLFVAFLHVCSSKTSLDRRFSDFKRCADEECSMLLCRGKASRDFSGPDCRFLPFKKGETIYVYYKLSGQRSDMWAGSVGSSFGYFPKDFLNINHIYTEEEVEVLAEETDFVCFDTGQDKFESYNIDLLLNNSLLLNEGDKQNEESEERASSEETEVTATDETVDQRQTDTVEVTATDETVDQPQTDTVEVTATDVETVDQPQTDTVEVTATDETVDQPQTDTVEVTATDVETVDQPQTDTVEVTATNETVDQPQTDTVEVTATDETVDQHQTDTVEVTATNETVDQRLTDTAEVTATDETVDQPQTDTAEVTATDETVDQRLTDTAEVTAVDETVDQRQTDTVEVTATDETVDQRQTDTVEVTATDETVDQRQTDTAEVTATDETVDQPQTHTAEVTATDVETVDQPQTDEADGDTTDSEPLHIEIEAEKEDYTEDISDVRSAEHIQLALETTASDAKDKVSDVVKDTTERHETIAEGTDSDLEETLTDGIPDEPLSKDDSVLQKSDHVTQVEAMPDLKTTLGTTFDAVVSDNEDTMKITPSYNEQENNKFVEQHSEQMEEGLKQPALLSFEDHMTDPAESKGEDVSLQTEKEAMKAARDSMWSSLGDTVFKIVSGGVRTDLPEDPIDDDDDEDDGEEEEDETETDTGEGQEEEEELKQSFNDLEKEDPNSSNVTQYIEVPEQDSRVLKHKNESEKNEINGKSELSENMLGLHETENRNSEKSEISKKTLHLDEAEIEDKDRSKLSENTSGLADTENGKSEKHDLSIENLDSNGRDTETTELSRKTLDLDEPPSDDAIAESERDAPVQKVEGKKLDKPLKTVLDAITNIELHKSEDLLKAHAQNSPQLDEKRDEQIDTDIHLFEDTLKTESKSEADDDTDVYYNNENIEELLEDENAVLSTKTESTDDGEESMENSKVGTELETTKLAPPIQPTGNQPKQTNERIKKETSGKTKSLDPSVSTLNEDTDTQSSEVDGADEIKQDRSPSEEPEYSDDVLRLTLLRNHFTDDEMQRLQRYLDLKDLFRTEAMFSELDQRLRSTRESESETGEDMERKLESIIEVSENSILHEIEKMLDTREQKDLGHPVDPNMFDDEAAILDDFQEFIFYLHQKYSAVSDSVPLVEESHSHSEMEKPLASEEDSAKSIPVPEVTETPKVHKMSEQISSINGQENDPHSQDMSLEEDGGHFNKNKDIQSGFKDTEEIQRGPQAILENPVDMAFGFEMQPSSGSLESPRTTDFFDNASYDQGSASTLDHAWDLLVRGYGFLGVYSDTLIAALPDEWRPGPTFHGLPWHPVLVTAFVGILTALMIIWRTVLTVKSRTYLLTEKQLAERIQQLISEKSDVLLKITELNNMIKQHEEEIKTSENSQSSLQEQYEDLKGHYQELLQQREELSADISHLGQKISDAQEEKKTLNEKMIIMQQRIEKYQSTLKMYDEDHTKVQVLMDEAKLREDALKAQVLSFEKDNGALKEQKKSLLRDAKNWKDKHEKLSEEMEVYHKTQKDLEDSLVHKENEIDVLSSCIAQLKGLEGCDMPDLQKGDAKVGNGEMADKSGDPIKMRLKQMMDVSRIKATLSVIEDERNRYFENLLTEQKARQELEEQFQKVVHDQTNLKNEKIHLESQYKNLQQRLEITTELYQQKENALQQKLTQEELERRQKESKLTEVDGRALQAEEELRDLRQKVKDMQEEMQQNERTLKAEIAVQEKKAHENWLKARSSERALIEERRESANLRQKIVECSDKMADLEHALYKPGPSDRHTNPLRIGDSYGPSPVSGGAPSPPLMMEGRPPSAPVGRRNDSFGPRPTDTGRFSDLGHPVPSRPEMFPPRTSSPCAQDGSQTGQVDAKPEESKSACTDRPEAFQLSRSQNQGSFLPSPIRESPAPSSNLPPKAYGSQPIVGSLAPPSNGPLPPMSRPPNGHPPMIGSGPPLGPDPRFRPPHMDSYALPPLRPFGPVPPAFARGLPLRDLPPMGPPPLRDLPPMGPPRPFGMHDFPPDFTGPRDLPFPPRPFAPGSLPPGALLPPPFSSREMRGPLPLVSHPPGDNEDITQASRHATEGPTPQGATQDTTTSAVAEP
ncbi:uncharacterized protein mia3 isoform X3 [Brachyhypopomus gauderio]|uniref:uncharacterized protein mia3 isoform X3 n=1 Tax=Brachyhypopomus gauderio TaxID=698409 RepID=UPI0040410BF8